VGFKPLELHKLIFFQYRYIMNFISVEPTDLTQVISKITINILHLELKTNATVQVLSYTDDNKLINSDVFELILPEYASWTNDEWLVEYVCQKYNYTLQNNLPV